MDTFCNGRQINLGKEKLRRLEKLELIISTSYGDEVILLVEDNKVLSNWLINDHTL